MRVSIKIKSTMFLATLLLLTVSILSILVLRGIKSNQQKHYEDFLEQQSKIANLYLRQSYLTENSVEVEEFLHKKGQELSRQLAVTSGMHVILYDMAGKEIGNSVPLASIADVRDTLKYSLKGKTAYEVVESSLCYLSPLQVEDKQIGVVRFNYSLKESNDFYNNIKKLFYDIGAIIFILSFIIGYLYFNQLSDGILKLKNSSEKIRLGQYNEVTILKRKDELGELSEGIYYMSNQIEKNIIDMNAEQEKLKLAVEKLKILEKQQKHFIGNITHEFKTPLTVIKAYVDLIEKYSDDPEFINNAKVNIGKETQRLCDMVEKILQLASLEKYNFEFQSERIEVKEVLNDICERMKGKAEKFGLSLCTDLQPANILADREGFIQVVINLLDNAIKYNEPNGKVLVKSYVENEKVFIEIKDTGIGIPKEMREKVFEPFYTVNKDRSKQSGGTGLGLSLVKDLVEKQHGTISIMDNEEKGTDFLILFPHCI